MIERLLYTREEAAQLLGGIHVRTLYELIHTGQIKVKRIGRRVFIPKQEIERFSRTNLTGFRADRGVDEHGRLERESRIAS